MRILLLFLLLTGCFCGQLSAQEDPLAQKKSLQFDKTENLDSLRFDRGQLQKYRNSKDFDYSDQSAGLSWWGRFVAWAAHLWNTFWKKVARGLSGLGGSWAGFLVNVLKYGIILGILALIVYLFIRLNPGRALLKNKTEPQVHLTEEEEIIQQENIPRLIDEALARQNYR